MEKKTAEAPKEIVLSVKMWKKGIKYPCPICSKKIASPYVCEPCNIKIKPVLNF